MICSKCRLAAEELQKGQPEAHCARIHRDCKGGTWCDCQHQMTGVNWAMINMEKRNESE